ncbi:MAG TPA: YsnF/AvaK domain-containing protein [Polyangia bacterium]|nr:YsnF/AvaK domain-containing protein [Polyangia bacterium]
MRWNQRDVKQGMIVTTSVGDRLGKVISCGAETFVVEKGVFSPKDYELRYDHILKVDSGGVTYSLTDLESRFGPAVSNLGAQSREAAATKAPEPEREPEPLQARSRDETPARQEVRIPLMEEEIGIEKVARESGHVRIHKTVKTEQKHITVPVTREDVVIERVAATEGEPSGLAEATFQEQTLDLPLHEEEVKVSKRPRLREQMVVRTVVQAVQKDASADLRHEEAEIEDTRSSHLADGGGEDTSEYPSGYGAPGRR